MQETPTAVLVQPQTGCVLAPGGHVGACHALRRVGLPCSRLLPGCPSTSVYVPAATRPGLIERNQGPASEPTLPPGLSCPTGPGPSWCPCSSLRALPAHPPWLPATLCA